MVTTSARVSQTVTARALDNVPGRQKRLTSLIIAGARHRYLRGEPIELTTLAAEYGVSRATAYRWLGDNDSLLAEVLAERVRSNFRNRTAENAAQSGQDRVLAVIAGLLRHTSESDRFAELLRRAPHRVLKILASDGYPVRAVTIGLFEKLLEEERSAGRLHLVAPSREISHAIVRLLESFLYASVVADELVDVESTVDLVRLLLRVTNRPPEEPTPDCPAVRSARVD
jgi:AcrR family transcriptional regulator